MAALVPAGGTVLLIACGPHTWAPEAAELPGHGSHRAYQLPTLPWHWPILSFASTLHAETPPLMLRWAALGLSVLLAWLTYRYIEGPCALGKRRRAKLAAIFVTSAPLAAMLIWRFDGVPDRLPPEAAQLPPTITITARASEGKFPEPDQPADAFARCPDTWNANGQTWLLWGDSHAAHLYPGIRAQFGAGVNIVQRTASGCPPFANGLRDRPHCPAIQARIWSEIEIHRPYRVTLAARWDFYEWRDMGQAIARLRELGVRQIELVGPVPQWHNGLPRLAAIAYRENGFSQLPSRLSRGLLPEPFQIDREMANMAESLGIRYLSPIQNLCNAEGCMIRSLEPAGALTAWDDAHLTASGSALLASRWAATPENNQ